MKTSIQLIFHSGFDEFIGLLYDKIHFVRQQGYPTYDIFNKICMWNSF